MADFISTVFVLGIVLAVATMIFGCIAYFILTPEELARAVPGMFLFGAIAIIIVSVWP